MSDQDKHIVENIIFVRVWTALIALTVITILVARLHLGYVSTLTALLIASAKAGLVLWYFMHLKYERKLFKFLLFVPLATLTVIIGLTFLDILYR